MQALRAVGSLEEAVRKKILMLDFDGVLNSKSWFVKRHAVLMAMPVKKRLRLSDQDLSPENLAELAFIAASVPDMKVVVSSTWRLGKSVGDLGRMLVQGGLHPSRVIGVTPRIGGERRGTEIQAWLDYPGNEANKDAEIVILDDDGDMLHLMHRLVQTDAEHGLTRADALRVVEMLSPAAKEYNCLDHDDEPCGECGPCVRSKGGKTE